MSIEKIKQLREITGAGMMDVKKALDETNGNIDKAIEWLRANGISKAAKKADRIAAEGSIFVANNSNKVIIVEINSETDFVATNDKFINSSNKITQAILNSSLKSNDINGALKIKANNDTIEEILIDMTATIGEKISLRRFEIHDLSSNINVGTYVHSNNKIGSIVIAENIDSSILKDVAMHIAAMSPKFLQMSDIPSDTVESETKLAKEQLKDTLVGKPENIQDNIVKGKVTKTLSENVLLEQPFVKDPSKKIKDLSGNGLFKSFIRFEVGEGIEKKVENFAEEVAKQVKK